MGIFFGAEIRQNKINFISRSILYQDQLYIKINLISRSNCKMCIKRPISKPMSGWRSESFWVWFALVNDQIFLDHKKINVFCPNQKIIFEHKEDEWGTKNNPNRTVTISSIFRHSK